MLVSIRVYADTEQKKQTFTIRSLKPNDKKIKIKNKEYGVNETFTATDNIIWTADEQEIRAISYPSNKPYIFSKSAFESKGVKSVFDFLYGQSSSRGSESNKNIASNIIIKKGVKNHLLYPEKRIALVIGNANYNYLNYLKNSFNDADKITTKLLDLGFDVITQYDCKYTEFKTVINFFFAEAKKYDISLIYYAGHGLQNDGINYLLPCDITMESSACLNNAITMNELVAFATDNEGVNYLFFIDACRDATPAWRRGTNAIASNQIEAPEGISIMYSTSSGNTADDGNNDNSPFATAFLDIVGRPGQPLVVTMDQIRLTVRNNTFPTQNPIAQNNITYDFYFSKQNTTINDVLVSNKNNYNISENNNPLSIPNNSNSTPIVGSINGHEYVDLGLSVLWATCNVGASKPEEYGNYYAWGEVLTKSIYRPTNYKWNITNDTSKIKYNTISDYGYLGFVDNKTNLDPEDDVAHLVWGDNWRIPTHEEFQELIDSCTWTWSDVNGIKGYLITSNIKGVTNNSIFLPTAGDSFDNNSKLHYDGKYWTSSLLYSWRHYNSPYCLGFTPDTVYFPDYFSFDYLGFSVRPVYKNSLQNKKNTTNSISNNTHNNHEYVDLGLSVKWATCNIDAVRADQLGSYFAWGDTEGKESQYSNDFIIDNYRFIKDVKKKDVVYIKKKTFSKYNTKLKYGKVDKKTELELCDDAAHVLWGGDWRLPTIDEFEELLSKCTWTEETIYGVKGYKVTSNIKGYTDKSIFLPLDEKDIIGSYYWSNSLYKKDPSESWALKLYGPKSYPYDNTKYKTGGCGRDSGLFIRPVCP